MSTEEQLAALLLGTMTVLTLLIAWRSRALRTAFPEAPKVDWRAGRGWRHPLGCVVSWVIAIPLVALVPFLALVPCATFFILATQKFGRSGAPDRRIAGILLLCSGVWLAYWGYETQLRQWMETVKGPIRADFMITAPLLYYVSAVGLALDPRPRAGR
ncbi:MAG TPA: hypothetical protein VJZ73_14700 [Methylomirabilota bacterium]|nr:hypothetical protein [Methylomirabilota bacterium]